jgi:hypothetical protein
VAGLSCAAYQSEASSWGDASLLGDATVVATKATAERFGMENISGRILALIVTVTK